MKIVFVSYTYWPPDFGGELLISIERFEELVKQGYKVTVLTSGKPGFARQEIINGIEVLRSPVIHGSKTGRLLRRLFFVLWVMYLLNRLEFDVVHLGSMPGLGATSKNFFGWIFAKLAKKRGARVLTVYSLADSESKAVQLEGLAGRVKMRYLKSVDHIVGVSPGLYDALTPFFQKRAVLLPCGVRDDLFTPGERIHRSRIREELGVSSEDVVFIFNGTIGYRKGFDVLASAFATLSAKHSTWRLWVIGPRNKLENQNADPDEVNRVIRPLEGNRHVNYLGRINDRLRLAQILAAGDVFVFPSRKEGMGIAPIEAMAAGLPVIVSKIPGITDLVNIHGITGLYVTPGAVEELQQAMEHLGTNPELRCKMGLAARERAMEVAGWQQHVARWIQLYSKRRVTE